MATVPVIDLSSFEEGGSQAERQKAADHLVSVCRELGFASIVGHGVPQNILDEAFKMLKILFDLPLEDKMKAPHPDEPFPHRGYSKPGQEKAYSEEELKKEELAGTGGKVIKKTTDVKESYEIGSEDDVRNPNIWLPEEVLPGFRAWGLKTYWAIEKAGRRVLEALCLGFHLTPEESNHIFSLHDGNNNQLRLLHYPSVPVKEASAGLVTRLPAHIDYGTVTLDFELDDGGLELESNSEPGKWYVSQPTPGSCLVNVAKMIEILTNGQIKAVMHRVTAPKEEHFDKTTYNVNGIPMTTPRYSIPFFVAPDFDIPIAPAQSLVDADGGVKRYNPITVQEYADGFTKYQYQKPDKIVQVVDKTLAEL